MYSKMNFMFKIKFQYSSKFLYFFLELEILDIIIYVMSLARHTWCMHDELIHIMFSAVFIIIFKIVLRPKHILSTC